MGIGLGSIGAGGLFGQIASGFAGPILGYATSRQQANAVENAAQTNADAIVRAAQIGADAAKFRPYNVYSGYGSGTFSGNNAYANLSPEYQNLRNQYLNYAQNTANGLNTYNPTSTAQDIYSKLRDISQYQRSQDQANLFDTLQAKGLTGLSNGQGQNPYARAFFDAQNNADLQREVNSYSLGQQLADQQLSRAINASSAGAGIDQLANSNLDLGGAFGGRASQGGYLGGALLSNAAANAGKLNYGAAVNSADTQAAFWNGLIPQINTGIQKLPGLLSQSPYVNNNPYGFFTNSEAVDQ